MSKAGKLVPVPLPIGVRMTEADRKASRPTPYDIVPRSEPRAWRAGSPGCAGLRPALVFWALALAACASAPPVPPGPGQSDVPTDSPGIAPAGESPWQVRAPIELVADDAYMGIALDRIAHARRSILVSMYLFRPGTSGRNRARQILDELAGAAERGVQVEVVLEKSDAHAEINEANEEAARLLLARKGKVWFDDARQVNHSKVLVIDDHTVLLGSHNLTQSALRYNRELSVLVDSPELAEQVSRFIRSIADRGEAASPAGERESGRPTGQGVSGGGREEDDGE